MFEKPHAQDVEPTVGETALQRMLERSFDFVGIVQDERIVYVNSAGQDLLGVNDQAQWLDVGVAQYIDPEAWASTKARLVALMSGQEGMVVETALVRHDGRHVDVELMAHPIQWKGAPAIQVVGRDITQRKHREAQLQGERHILELVATSAPLTQTLVAITRLVETQCADVLASILLLDDQGSLHIGAAPSLPDWYNAAVDGQKIGPAAGTCGTAAYRKAPVTTRDIASDPLWHEYRSWAVKAGLSACWSTPLMTGDGRVLGTLAHYYRIPQDPTPRALELTDIARHLAEIAIQRFQAEAALKQANEDLERRVEERSQALHASERLLREAEQQAHLGSWRWDVASNIVHWSDELYRIYGIESHGFGATFESFLGQIRPDQRERVRETVLGSLHSGLPYAIEERIIRPSGEERVLESSGRVELDDRHQPVRMWGICLDVTERKRIEEERAQSEQREREALAQVQVAHDLDQLRNTFINSISHDLKTPLTAIIGFLEFIEDGLNAPDPTVQLEYIRGAYTNTRRLERLVDDLLDSARLKAGTFALYCQPSDFGAVVNDVVDSLRPQAEAARVRIAKRVPPEPLVVPMDPQRIEQVVANLLTNALKFSPADDEVQLVVERLSGRVRFAVQDRGAGISPADQPKLFQMFSQLPAGLGKGGTGLGLAISKNLIEAHGGSIGVDSEPGVGSTFWFELPQAAATDLGP